MKRRLRGAVALLCLLVAGGALAADAPRDEQTRPPVTGRVGVVTSLHPLSSMAGMRLLLAGGNAFDAAVAAAIATTVVDPKNSTIGGQGFATVYVAKERAVRALNFYGVAPRAATIERLADKPYKMGYLSTPVPSNLKGYEALHRKYGVRPWAEVVQPAIELAEQGFLVTEEFVGILGVHAKELQEFPSTRRTFFPEGRLPRVGEVFRQPDLARTLQRIAGDGADVFYKGEIARSIAAFYAEHGGILAYEDLASYEAKWVEPISVDYRGYQVYTQPPNSSGIAVLMQLRLLEGFDLEALGHNSAAYLHLIGEVQRLAIADRNRYVADPEFVAVPLSRLLSREYAAERRKLISPDRAMPVVMPPDEDTSRGPDKANTTHLTVVDAAGNMVALTQTLGSWYGSGVVAADTGVLFSNQLRHLHTGGRQPVETRTRAAPALESVAAHRPQGRPAVARYRHAGLGRHLAAPGAGHREHRRLRHGHPGRGQRAADDLRRLPGNGHRRAAEIRRRRSSRARGRLGVARQGL